MLFLFDVFLMSDVSTLFELLAADVRRRILYMLCESDTLRIPEGLQTRGAVQAHQSRGEHTCSTVKSHQDFEVQLYHTHLPKLETEEVIEWDRDRQTVSRGPAFESIEPSLRMLAANATTLPGELF